MKLKANFVNDWHDILRDVMVQHWGYDVSNIDEQDIPIVYYNAMQRRIACQPRQVVTSDIFQCPDQHSQGWSNLKASILKGEDVTPYLSKSIENITYPDSMLNDWGVYHFHLGEESDGRFITRTGPLLFALVKADILYAINVYHHEQWTDSNIVETIHRNWPSLVGRYIVKGIQPTQNITNEEKKT